MKSRALYGFIAWATIIALLCLCSGCGFYVPQIQERWENVGIDNDMEFRIKRNIFCELVEAIKAVNRADYVARTSDSAPPPTQGSKPIPDNYSVQMQITLTVDENSAANPGITYNNTLANATVAGVTVGRMFNLGAGATLSADATRTDTSYSYFNVGKIASGNANKPFCEDTPIDRRGSSLLLQSDLGIESYLRGAVKGNDFINSSAPPRGKKDLKLDVYSYEIKFIVITNSNINPVWKLVSVSANSGTLPLLSAGRTRTHDLILTFGPSGTNGYEPSPLAVQQLLSTQLNTTLQRVQVPTTVP